MTYEDHDKVQDLYRKTGCSSISEYGRKVLLNIPVRFFTRDKSLDEMCEQFIQFRKAVGFLLKMEGMSSTERKEVMDIMRTIQLNMEEIARLCLSK
jgi:hypothetical protein